MISWGISKLHLAWASALVFIAVAAIGTSANAHAADHAAGTIEFTRENNSGAQDTLGIYCDKSAGNCVGRRKHNGGVVFEKPVSRRKAEALLRQYSKPDKLPPPTAPLSGDVRKMNWRLVYGNFLASGDIAIPSDTPVDSRVRILEAELSALVGRAP